MKKWTSFKKQAAASNRASCLPPTSLVRFTESDATWSGAGVQMLIWWLCQKQQQQKCFKVCIDTQLLHFIPVSNYILPILSSWFSRWSCNICLHFPLANMYHCGYTDKRKFEFPALHLFIHFIQVGIWHHFETAHGKEPQDLCSIC